MEDAATDPYAAALAARWAGADLLGRRRLDEPGVRGLVSDGGEAATQLLVVDDRALEVLAALLPRTRGGTVRVYDAAPRCAELLERRAGWVPAPVTGMVRGDLGSVPEPSLPSGLTLHRVRRRDDTGRGAPVGGSGGSRGGAGSGEAASDVALVDAVEVAIRAAGPSSRPGDGLVRHLASLPADARLWAAVDGAGAVRGTSGSRTFGAQAWVFFVNTDPAWRGRGVGRAMTAVALRHTAGNGAERAALDASRAGRSLYLRLGFVAVRELWQFNRSA